MTEYKVLESLCGTSPVQADYEITFEKVELCVETLKIALQGPANAPLTIVTQEQIKMLYQDTLKKYRESKGGGL